MEKIYCLSQECFNKHSFSRFILVADIKGDFTVFAVMGVVSKKHFEIVSKYKIKTNEINFFPNLINEVLKEAHNSFRIEISRAVIAGAGVISRFRNKLKINNHDLEICVNDIKNNTLLLKAILINNFESEGFGIDFVNEEKIEKITTEDIKVFGKSSLIFGVDYDLGASINYHDLVKHLRVPISTEAGGIDFPVSCFFDLELVNYTRKKLFNNEEIPISSETFISEKGLCLIYEFIINKKLYGNPDLEVENLNTEEKIEFIFNNQQDIYCRRAVELFVIFYARTARNLALSCEPYSGLFLTGKLAIKAKKTIKELFIEEFTKHSTQKTLLAKIPVFIVHDEDFVLFGACNTAINFYNMIH